MGLRTGSKNKRMIEAIDNALAQETDECVRWTGRHRKQDGRPMANGKYAYRVLWELVNGPIEIGLHHKCENKWCVNLRHLEPKIQADHIIDHGLPGDNHNYLKTYCPKGHEYDYVWTDPVTGRVERGCKTCRNENRRAYRARGGRG